MLKVNKKNTNYESLQNCIEKVKNKISKLLYKIQNEIYEQEICGTHIQNINYRQIIKLYQIKEIN
jgi:hypothetical protein